MIDATEFRRLVEAAQRDDHASWQASSVAYSAFADFCLSHATELLALVEADKARRKKALDELLAMDADLYDDPPAPEQKT